jgi:hypothetical protein
MKYGNAILLLCLFIFCQCANQGTKSKHSGVPVLNFDKQIVDIGNIKSGIPYSSRVVIRNVGTVDLILSDITTDCACTVADISNKKILPGDSIYLTYTLDPHTIGFFQQKIIISNNSANNPVLLMIRGKTLQ